MCVNVVNREPHSLASLRYLFLSLHARLSHTAWWSLLSEPQLTPGCTLYVLLRWSQIPFLS